MPAQMIDSDWAEVYNPRTRAVAGAPSPGRYEGTVKRDTDGSTYLRAVELGDSDGSSVSISIFDQLGGTLPATPQFAGEATVLGSILLFNTKRQRGKT
jgi:hypothetical protein